MEAAESWTEVGDRVRQARLAARMSQAEVAGQLGIDRSALARMEGGQRQISALELFALADLFHVPIGHFVTRPPAAVVSRRLDLAEDSDQVSRARFRMDAALEAQARDANWLLEHGFLPTSDIRLPRLTGSGEPGDGQPEEAARALRRSLDLAPGPLGRMADVLGAAGLHPVVMPGLEAGASLLLRPGLGVAVIGGDDEPGRRRFTAAHELGHYVLQDEYTTDIGVAASRSEREQRIDLFAVEMLLPERDLRADWAAAGQMATRERLILVAGRYRVSWSVAIRGAVLADLITSAETTGLKGATPRRGEFLEILGHEPPPDLGPGETSAGWRQAVLQAWRTGDITAERVGELLHGVITPDDLPERELPDIV